ncbi:hypothetical protein FCM35_KLT07433 [Carex littledalei]|uniref:Uncharacterized protein n=1 Tax=Carex littledalei TaxID=544730 RepID=A0A833VI21_9POAL|nr:hypothetical protein FCM35_KLT07433 [Carex littledalei]
MQEKTGKQQELKGKSIVVVLLNYPYQHTFVLSNTQSDFHSQQMKFNNKCPIKTCPCLEPKTSVDLLCKLVSVDVIKDLKQIYCKSSTRQQCVIAFDIAGRICADLSGKPDGSDIFLHIILEIILDYETTVENSNDEQHAT